MVIRFSLTGLVVLASFVVLAGCDSTHPGQRSSPPRAPVIEEPPIKEPPWVVQGRVESLPGNHAYVLTVTDGNVATFGYEPALPATDGAIYAAIIDAIEVAYPGRTGDYLTGDLKLQKLETGLNAITLETEEYRYIAVPVKAEDRGGKIIGMRFWREIKPEITN